jgi:hypothetical protein
MRTWFWAKATPLVERMNVKAGVDVAREGKQRLSFGQFGKVR